MLINDKEINIKSLNDVFIEHQAYHRMKLVCCPTALNCYQYLRKANSVCEGNVSTFPQSYHEYEIHVSGEALNCFESHPISIYVSFKQDWQAWKKYGSTIQNVINSQSAIFVSSDVYNVLDGEINFYNPSIIVSTV